MNTTDSNDIRPTEAAESKLQLNIDKTVRSKNHQCDWVACDKRFWTNWSLQAHRRSHTGERPFACPLCRERFTQKQNRDRHVQVMHYDVSRGALGAQGKRKRPSAHTQLGNPPANDATIIKTPTSHLERPRPPRPRGPFVCAACDTRCVDKAALVVHVFSADGLVTHESTFVGANPFVCPTCGTRFTRKGTLTNHIGRTHPTAKLELRKRFVCPHGGCTQRFWTSRDLQSHGLLHTGDRPYVCRRCPVRFKATSGRTHHEQLKHNVSLVDQKPFGCDECARRFDSYPRLNYHRLTHREQKILRCDECDAHYNRAKYLAHHIDRCHSGMYHCRSRSCEERFAKAHQLLHHNDMTHTVEPPACHACLVVFRTKSTLHRHFQRRPGCVGMPTMPVMVPVVPAEFAGKLADCNARTSLMKIEAETASAADKLLEETKNSSVETKATPTVLEVMSTTVDSKEQIVQKDYLQNTEASTTSTTGSDEVQRPNGVSSIESKRQIQRSSETLIFPSPVKSSCERGESISVQKHEESLTKRSSSSSTHIADPLKNGD